MLLESLPKPRLNQPSVARPSRVAAHRSTHDLETMVDTVASTSLPVLVCGECGTGKSSYLESIVRRSGRASASIVRLNARALPSEEELFGVERRDGQGPRAVDGILTKADGGLVIVEDIDELPAALERRFVRLFQDGELSPVGSSITRRVELRLLATCSGAEPARSPRMNDLVHRLFAVTLTLPPLRKRPDDIEALARHFARLAMERSGPEPIVVFTRDAVAKLRSHAWPKNAHELRRAVEDAVVAARGAPIDALHLAFTVTKPASTENDGERERLLAALAEGAWNQSRAAEILGVSRRTVIRKMERFAIPRPRKG